MSMAIVLKSLNYLRRIDLNKFKKINNKYLCFTINKIRRHKNNGEIQIYESILYIYEDEGLYLNFFNTIIDDIKDSDYFNSWQLNKLWFAIYLIGQEYSNYFYKIKDIIKYELDLSKKKLAQSYFDKIEYEYKSILNQILELEPFMKQSNFYLYFSSYKDDKSLKNQIFEMYLLLIYTKIRKIKLKTKIKFKYDISEYDLKREIIEMFSYLEELFKNDSKCLITFIGYKINQFYIEYMDDKKTALKELKKLIDKYKINISDESIPSELKYLINQIV